VLELTFHLTYQLELFSRLSWLTLGHDASQTLGFSGQSLTAGDGASRCLRHRVDTRGSR